MGVAIESVRSVGGVTPQEENTYLTDSTTECAHLLLQGVYGYFPHHNNGLHLDGEFLDDAVW